MLEYKFQKDLPYRAVTYARMSSDKQNPRSPDQQQDEINRTLKSQNLNWQITEMYRDDGISGRFIKKRPGFQKMLSDIKSGKCKVDLVLVDTFERLGRSEDIHGIVTELRKYYGVLVLSADSRFEDPTTAQGQIYGAFQALRATEENRVKGHQVRRGKLDILKKKLWPGGVAPFGYNLKSVFNNPASPSVRTGTVLEINPEEAAVIRMLFQRAYETSHGQKILAKWLNESSEIPDKFKNFNGSTVERWLGKTLYKGEMTWGVHQSDVIDDSWVRRRNPDDEHVVIPDYCEPIVEPEIWNEIQRVRQERRLQTKAKLKAEDEKLIESFVPFVSVKHLLSGLVRCGKCNSGMRVVTSGRKSKAGDEYCYFSCARYLDGACSNSKHIPEKWLNDLVLNELKQSLFENVGKTFEDLESNPQFQQLVSLVQEEFDKFVGQRELNRPQIKNQIQQLDNEIRGWIQSLNGLDLDPASKEMIRESLKEAQERKRNLESSLSRQDYDNYLLASIVEAKHVADRLERLNQVLSSKNPSLGNIELSQYVEQITCYPDGRTVLKTCRLGCLPGGADLFSCEDRREKRLAELNVDGHAKPRKRLKRDLRHLDDQDGELDDLNHWATNPFRFAGLDDVWFEEREFYPPEKVHPYQEIAPAVAEKRKEGLTHEKLAEHFGVTTPTIRKALKHAAKADPSLLELPRKVPERRWHEDHAEEVFAMRQTGKSTKELAAHFRKSTCTILKAIRFAKSKRDNPDQKKAS